MRKIKQIMFLVTLLFQAITFAQAYGVVRYVKEGGTGNGTSWADASGDLQAVINSITYADQIWIAKGTYKPNRRIDNLNVITPNDQNNSFVIKDGIRIYGGFAGTESTLQDRDLSIQSNETILDGNIGLSDFSSDNVFHVVVLANNAYNILDGLTIMNGVASSLAPNFYVNQAPISGLSGGGLYCINSAPKISNVMIKNNWARNEGGGMFVIGRAAVWEPVLSLVNTIFWGNSTSGKGGAIFSANSEPRVTNCNFHGNYAERGGGALCARDSKAVIYNSIFTNNTISSNWVGIDIYVDDFNYPKGYQFIYPDVYYSIMQEYRGLDFYNNNNNYIGNYQVFTNPANGDFRLKKSSFVAYDTGTNNVPGITLPTKDKVGNSRIINNTIDRGAYEYINFHKSSDIKDVKSDEFYVNQETNFSIFPNPVNDILNIKYDGLIKSVELYDLQGQLVLTTNQKTLEISKLQSGVYVLKIQDEKNNIVYKQFLKN